MIIKFSKDLELSDWCIIADYNWCRYKQRTSGGMIFHERALVILYTQDNIVKYIRFHRPLYELDELYNPKNIILDWNLEFAKNSVDNFLIKMIGLTAFL